MLMVQGLGFCFWAHATTSSKAQGKEVLKKQAVYLELWKFTTRTSFSCCIARDTVILVVQVSGNKTIFFKIVVAVVATEQYT